jgi:tetratricopeptide (TPR) repeat protein
MTSSYYSKKASNIHQTFFQKQSTKNCKSAVKHFKKSTFYFAFVKVVLLLTIIAEILCFFTLFPLFNSSILFATTIGSLFLTTFIYFVLLFYFETKKPEVFDKIKNNFLTCSRQSISIAPNTAEYSLSIIQTLLKLTALFNNFEYSYYKLPRWLNFLSPITQNISLLLHKKDVFALQEMLFLEVITEHINQIKYTPTDLEIHASLASTYVSFSKFYMSEENKLNILEKHQKKKRNIILKEKSQFYAHRAIEEYMILRDYAPNDPWVHAQLAQSYKTLEILDKEALELENILKLSPNDTEIMYRLGIVYFKLGKNSKGLNIYEKLIKKGIQKAENLLDYYGTSSLTI